MFELISSSPPPVFKLSIPDIDPSHYIFNLNFSNLLDVTPLISSFEIFTLYKIEFSHFFSNVFNTLYTFIPSPSQEYINQYRVPPLNFWYSDTFNSTFTKLSPLLTSSPEGHTVEVNLYRLNKLSSVEMYLRSPYVKNIYLKEANQFYLVSLEYLRSYKFEDTHLKVQYKIDLQDSFLLSKATNITCAYLSLNQGISQVKNIKAVKMDGLYSVDKLSLFDKGKAIISKNRIILGL